jgi:outer membrane protein TolC
MDGLKDFICVLDAQRARFVAEDNLVVSSTEVTASLIRLYKALGGGWNHL